MGKLGLVELIVLLFTAFFLIGVPFIIAAVLLRRSDKRARSKQDGDQQMAGEDTFKGQT